MQNQAVRLTKMIVLCVGLVLMSVFVFTPHTEAVYIYEWVADLDSGTGYNANFYNNTVTMDLDPAKMNWLAWHNDTSPYVDGNGKEWVGAYEWVAVDDYFKIQITDPNGNQTALTTMDWNNSVGTPSGQQAVLYGDAATTPDVHRADLYGTNFTLDESGLFNSFFNNGGAGTYTFAISMYNAYTANWYTPDFYLLADVETCPPPIPEPATMAVLGLGSLGLLGFRRKK